MYFSLSELKTDRAAQLALMTASELGDRMFAGEEPAVAFESAIASISQRSGISDTVTVAAQLLAQDTKHRQIAIKLGMRELVNLLGGDKNAANYFQQITLPRARIRFDSVGGVQDDVLAAKNRSAMLAIRAAFARKLMPKEAGVLPAESEYIEFVKSVHRTLESSTVDATLGNEVGNEINSAAIADVPQNLRARIVQLQAEAIGAVAMEARQRIMARYRAPSLDSTGPSVH